MSSDEASRPFSTKQIVLRVLGIVAAILGGAFLTLKTAEPEFLFGALGLAAALAPVRAPAPRSAVGVPLPMNALIAGGGSRWREPQFEELPRQAPADDHAPSQASSTGQASPLKRAEVKVKPVQRPSSVGVGSLRSAHQPKLRCPYCRGGFHAHEETATCAGCSTLLHRACQIESGEACMTLGCEKRVARQVLELAS